MSVSICLGFSWLIVIATAAAVVIAATPAVCLAVALALATNHSTGHRYVHLAHTWKPHTTALTRTASAAVLGVN